MFSNLTISNYSLVNTYDGEPYWTKDNYIYFTSPFYILLFKYLLTASLNKGRSLFTVSHNISGSI